MPDQAFFTVTEHLKFPLSISPNLPPQPPLFVLPNLQVYLLCWYLSLPFTSLPSHKDSSSLPCTGAVAYIYTNVYLHAPIPIILIILIIPMITSTTLQPPTTRHYTYPPQSPFPKSLHLSNTCTWRAYILFFFLMECHRHSTYLHTYLPIHATPFPPSLPSPAFLLPRQSMNSPIPIHQPILQLSRRTFPSTC